MSNLLSKNLVPACHREITREISTYFVFILILIVITVGDKDETYFHLKDNFNTNFITKNPNGQVLSQDTFELR